MSRKRQPSFADFEDVSERRYQYHIYRHRVYDVPLDVAQPTEGGQVKGIRGNRSSSTCTRITDVRVLPSPKRAKTRRFLVAIDQYREYKGMRRPAGRKGSKG